MREDEDVRCIPDSSNYTSRDNEHYFLCMERRGRCYICLSLGGVDGRIKEDKGSMSWPETITAICFLS